jgi:hypothetical protein
MTEVVTHEGHMQLETMPSPEVDLQRGSHVLVKRGNGRVEWMTVHEISPPQHTFDDSNKPVNERFITVFGNVPEKAIVNGVEVDSYPLKVLPEDYFNTKHQETLRDTWWAQEEPALKALQEYDLASAALAAVRGTDIHTIGVKDAHEAEREKL